MKKRVLNKKGTVMLGNFIVFILLVIAFSALILVAITRFGTQTAITEQIYAKQIALTIDKSRPGTGIILDAKDIFKKARDNKFKGELIHIDNDNKKIIVHLIEGKGYSYSFFSNYSVSWNINEKEEKLFLHIL